MNCPGLDYGSHIKKKDTAVSIVVYYNRNICSNGCEELRMWNGCQQMHTHAQPSLEVLYMTSKHTKMVLFKTILGT